MFKLRRNKEQKIDIELIGEFTPDSSKIKPYEQYVKEEEEKQLLKEIKGFLQSILPQDHGGLYDVYVYMGQTNAIEAIANYLVKNASNNS